jgi:predicted O-methyltransferase YrrM
MAKSKSFKTRFTPTNNDLSYYPLLYMALEETKHGDVVEMGTGYGSTQLLHDYCSKAKRNLFSFDEKEEWGSKFYSLRSGSHKVEVVKDWDVVKDNHMGASVVFIDHAPGERRKEDIVNFQHINGILVCHDTEPAADYGYQMRQRFGLFKYVVEVKTEGAWATALSNTHDVTKWSGQRFGTCYVIG